MRDRPAWGRPGAHWGEKTPARRGGTSGRGGGRRKRGEPVAREDLSRPPTDGRLFPAVRGGRLRSTEYTEAWQAARQVVLTPQELKTPLAEDPYCNRAAGVSLWIAQGLEPAEVARRAGHSVAVLYRFYAKVLRKDQTEANRRIAAALEAPE